MTPQQWIPEMPDDFRSLALDKPVLKPESSAITAMQREAFDFHQGNAVPEVASSSDRTSFRRNADQLRQSIVSDLEEARRQMTAWHETARLGAPVTEANRAALQRGLMAYERAQQQADQFLFQIDPQTGRPATNAHGEPIRSNFHVQLRREHEQLAQEINELRNQNTPTTSQALQEKLQTLADVNDLMRMSGYVRANRGLATLFGCAHLRGEDLIRQRQEGNLQLMAAAQFDPAMMGPPPDRNFMRHYLRAQQTSGQTNPPQEKPTLMVPPFKPPVKPGEQQNTLPFKPPVKPGDQQNTLNFKPPVKPIREQEIPPFKPPVKPQEPLQAPLLTPAIKPGLQLPRLAPQVKPGPEQTIQPGKPIVKPVNEQNVHPDKPLVQRVNEQNVQPGTPIIKPVNEQNVQPGTPIIKPVNEQSVQPGKPIIKPVDEQYLQQSTRVGEKPASNVVIGADGRPRVRSGDYTLPTGGIILRPALDAQNRPLGIDNQPLTDSQGQWRTGADGRPVQMRLSGSDPDGLLYNALAAVSNSRIQPENRTSFRQAISAADNLNRETLLARAQENQQTARQFANAMRWLGQLLEAQGPPANNESLRALQQELQLNQELAAQVNFVRVAQAESEQLEMLFVSPVTVRRAYIDALMQDPEVLAFAQLPQGQKASSPLRQNANVQEAQQMLRELAGMDGQAFAAGSEQAAYVATRADQLGVVFTRSAVADKPQPAQQSLPEKTNPAKPQDKTQQQDLVVLQAKPGKPGDTQAPAGRITEEQDAALASGHRLRLEFMQQTQAGSQRMPAERWGQVKTQMEQLITIASSVSRQTTDALAGAVLADYQRQLQNTLQITPEQLAQRVPQLSRQHLEIADQLARAQASLPQEKQSQLAQIESNFLIAVEARRAEQIALINQQSGNDPARRRQLLAAAQLEFQRWIEQESARVNESKKALSPQMRTALDAQISFLNRPEGPLTAQFNDFIQKLDQLDHAAAWLRMYYAQMLHMQGETDAAREQMRQAISDSVIAREVDSSQEGQALSTALNVLTPLAQEAQRRTNADFPEYAPFRQAQAILADRSRDPHQAFSEACTKFEEAIRATQDRKPHELRAAANGVRLSLESLLGDLQSGTRRASTPEEVNAIRQQGENLTSQMQKLKQQAENVAELRYHYAVALSNYGFEHNNQAAKDKALSTLEGIAEVDRHTFDNSPEIQGALLQLRAGRRIVPAAARPELMVNLSLNAIAGSSGLIDIPLPDASGAFDWITGGYASRIPLAGPIFFGDVRGAQNQALRPLVESLELDADATQRAVDQQSQGRINGLRNVLGDTAAVGAGLLTRYGLSRLPAVANGHWSLRLGGLGLQMAVAGLARDSADGHLGDGRDWLRGAGMYGGSLLLMRGMATDPTRHTLSAGTSEALAARYGLAPGALSNATSRGVYESVLARRALLNTQVGAGGVGSAASGELAVLNQQLGGRWGITNYNPLSTHAWSAEAAAQALTRGEITLGQFWARQHAGRLWSVAGSGALFGGGREALYIGTGETRTDGTPHTWQSAWSSIVRAGGTGAVSTLLLPTMVGGTIRMIPRVGPRIMDGSANLLSGGLRAAGVPQVSAAGAWYAMPEVSVQSLANLGQAGVPMLLSGIGEGNKALTLRRYSDQARGLVQMFDEAQLPPQLRQEFMAYSAGRGSLADLPRVQLDLRQFALEMSANFVGREQERRVWDEIARRAQSMIARQNNPNNPNTPSFP